MSNRQQGPVPAAEAAPAQGEVPAAGQQKQMKITDAIATAGRLVNAGRLDQAENICRQILTKRPNIPDANNILSVTLFRKGKTEEAIEAVKKAIKSNRNAPNYFSNLGEMERVRGNFEEATKALERAVQLDPKSPQALNNLGIVNYDKRNFAEAIILYEKAISIDANYAEAHNNLGNALRTQGKFDLAIAEYEAAIEVRENYPEAYNNMGTVFRDMQKVEEAEASFRRAIALRGNYLEALNNLSSILVGQKRYEDALRILGDTLKLHPDNVATLLILARAQSARGAHPMAMRAVKKVLEQAPENVEALILAGHAAHDLDQYDESLGHLEKALEIQPKNIEALNFYGVVLKSVGRLDDARKTFITALETQPRAIGTYSNLVDLEKFTPENELFQTMERIMGRVKNPDDARYMALHYALGKAYDDIGDYKKAFHHYSTGAKLKRPTLTYNEAEVFSFFDDIKKIFNEEFFEKHKDMGNPSTAPIFIVGMPRSGSTLTEQIVSSHPRVFGAGEIKNLSVCIGMLRQKFPSLPKFPALAEVIKPTQLSSIAKNYLGMINKISNSSERVTDKLLTNFFFAGLIHTMFPNAKIIHTARNPVDSCLSTYTKLFKDDMPHSYDLAELGRYYGKYQELMAHWRGILPATAFTEIQYEEMVNDTETHARRLIEFCGLEWDPICLKSHESNRPVKTASVSQVRKPIYKTSVERWRRYGDSLNPLIEALGMEVDNPA